MVAKLQRHTSSCCSGCITYDRRYGMLPKLRGQLEEQEAALKGREVRLAL